MVLNDGIEFRDESANIGIFCSNIFLVSSGQALHYYYSRSLHCSDLLALYIQSQTNCIIDFHYMSL